MLGYVRIQGSLQVCRSVGLLSIAAAFGLTTGLLEGLGLLIFHGYGWGNSRIPEGVSASIVWISAAVNLGLFLLAAFLFLLIRGLSVAIGRSGLCCLYLRFCFSWTYSA